MAATKGKCLACGKWKMDHQRGTDACPTGVYKFKIGYVTFSTTKKFKSAVAVAESEE